MSSRALPAAQAGRVLVEELAEVPRDGDGQVDLDTCARLLQPADLLESATGDGYSYLVPHGTYRLVDDGRSARLEAAGRPAVDLGRDPFDAIDTLSAALGVGPGAPPEPDLPPLTGGLVGMLSYDLARRIEHLEAHARDDRGTPALSLRVAEVVVAVPATRDRLLLLVRPLPSALAQGDAGQRASAQLRSVRTRLAAAARRRTPTTSPVPVPPQPAWTALPRGAHLAAIERVLDHIARGEVFQVNLAQRLSARWPSDVHDLYRALRAASPAAYGAVLPDTGLASISPESFLCVEGTRVTTRPIKGTRPRASDAALDAALADDLATAAKDRAENVMVVDLERNDLGRVCIAGSVTVPELTRIEAHPTVWHLVSTVTGRLPPEVGYGDLLRATFPCGSITGAPKVAAMRIIERLEPVRRGPYCGAIGFLSHGRAQLSVAIRTAVLGRDGVADHGAGGGIVADSDPDQEHAESLDKAVAFLTAVRASRVVAAGSRTEAPPGRRSVAR